MVGCSTTASRPRTASIRGLGAPGRRPRSPRDPAVHERDDRRPQGRDAPAPHASPRTSTRSSQRRGARRRPRPVVSWLPLYHDMGLIGLLTSPMLTGVDLVLAAPQDFLAAPGALAASGCRPSAAPSPPGPTSPTRSPPARLRPRDGLDLSPLAPRAQRRRAGRPRLGRGVRAPPARRHGLDARRRVPGVRHGRGDARGHVPRARRRA